MQKKFSQRRKISDQTDQINLIDVFKIKIIHASFARLHIPAENGANINKVMGTSVTSNLLEPELRKNSS